ncbi:MAG: hypothetical protein EAZ35_02305 [Sphingobacteriia bacterium]|nr:MAG: hypothetical protein EAZ35_02305 [Sphingobacteriia bacterium]
MNNNQQHITGKDGYGQLLDFFGHFFRLEWLSVRFYALTFLKILYFFIVSVPVFIAIIFFIELTYFLKNNYK